MKVVCYLHNGIYWVARAAAGFDVERDIALIVPSGATDIEIVDRESVPADRTFRAAWKPGFKIDMEKAKNIWREKIRQKRKDVLSSLDMQYMQADEIDDKQKKKAISIQKQFLRDLPADKAIEDATTPEALLAHLEKWPEEMKK